MLHVKFVCGLIISGARHGAPGPARALAGLPPTAVIVRAVLSETPQPDGFASTILNCV